MEKRKKVPRMAPSLDERGGGKGFKKEKISPSKASPGCFSGRKGGENEKERGGGLVRVVFIWKGKGQQRWREKF